jgi:hypothetical protein
MNDSRPQLIVFVSLFCVIAATLGCGFPAVEPENLALITSLRTALSARNETWLQQNEDLVEKRYAAQEMGESSYHAFKQIIQQARSGEWKEAELESLKFQRAQRPTPEQIDRLPKRSSR